MFCHIMSCNVNVHVTVIVMYVCVCVCTNVRTYILTQACVNVHLYVSVHVCVCMHGWKDGRMDGCTCSVGYCMFKHLRTLRHGHQHIREVCCAVLYVSGRAIPACWLSEIWGIANFGTPHLRHVQSYLSRGNTALGSSHGGRVSCVCTCKFWIATS